MLWRANGKKGTTEALKEWLANKDRDLREGEEDIESGTTSRTEKKSSTGGA
jgi:hypothetical protein